MQQVKLFIAWFLALHGLIRFYPKSATGKLTTSRFMQTYSVLYSLLMFFCVPSMFLYLTQDNPKYVSRMSSNCLKFAILLDGVVHATAALSTLYCTQFLQPGIRRIFNKLQKLELDIEPLKDRRYLYVNLCLKVFLICYQFVCQILCLFWLWPKTFSVQTVQILSRVSIFNLIATMSLLTFFTLWRIYCVGVGIQSQFVVRLKLRESLQLFRKIQIFLDLCAEFCQLFGVPLFCNLLVAISTGILNGYFFIRLLFDREHLLLITRQFLIIVVSAYSVYSLAEFFLLNHLAKAVSDLPESILAILRQSRSGHKKVDRSLDWLILQLSCRSTDIQTFGMITLNQRLSFVVMTQIILNAIYMIQSDYNIFM